MSRTPPLLSLWLQLRGFYFWFKKKQTGTKRDNSSLNTIDYIFRYLKSSESSKQEMSAPVVMDPSNTGTNIDETATQSQVESASCACCGLTEECTQAYIQRIRERYQGKWICGLCAEAVKYEMRMRNEPQDEALIQHMSFCNNFKSSSSPPPNPALHLISAMRSILRRSLDSPRSMPTSPTTRRAGGLSRTGSCHVPAVSPIHLDESASTSDENTLT